MDELLLLNSNNSQKPIQRDSLMSQILMDVENIRIYDEAEQLKSEQNSATNKNDIKLKSESTCTPITHDLKSNFGSKKISKCDVCKEKISSYKCPKCAALY